MTYILYIVLFWGAPSEPPMFVTKINTKVGYESVEACRKAFMQMEMNTNLPVHSVSVDCVKETLL